MKNYLIIFVTLFMRTTTWTLLSTASFISIFYHKEKIILGIGLLWQMLGISAITAVCGTVLFGNADKLSKRAIVLRHILCYLLINVVILTGGFYFEWFSPSNWKMVLAMLLLIFCGYFTIQALSYYLAQQESDLMNERLKEREKQGKD